MFSERERERQKRVVISFFSRPDTGCVVKGRDRVGGGFFSSSFFFLHPSSPHWAVLGTLAVPLVNDRSPLWKWGEAARRRTNQTPRCGSGWAGTWKRGAAPEAEVSLGRSRCHSAPVGSEERGAPRSSRGSADCRETTPKNTPQNQAI